MKLTTYQGLISSLPVREQSFTTKRSTWEKTIDDGWLSELNNQIFKGNAAVELSRQDIFLTNGNLREKIVKTMYWGYPTKGRGSNAKHTFEHIHQLEDALMWIESIADPGTHDFGELLQRLNNIKGVGMSTLSKLLYFMGIHLNGKPCLILDQRLLDVFESRKFDEFDEISNIRYLSTGKNYISYLSLMDRLAIQLNTKGENIEQFLFLFGKNLKH